MATIKDTTSYLRNPNLKAANVKLQYTPEQIGELVKCSEDPEYFIRNYVHIVNVDKGLTKFDLYPFQEKIIHTIHDNRFVICKIPRQSGKTTTFVSYLLWYVLFNRHKSVAILANKGRIAIEIMDKFQLAYEHIPKWMQQGVIEWNKGNIELENGCKVLASTTSSSAVRGLTFNIILLDEFAHVETHVAEEFFMSVYPTIASGKSTKVFIVSTPKGLNMFYKIWTDAVEGRNEYKVIDVHWTEVPGRDEKWKQETINNTSEYLFTQEFETEFLGSADTLISGKKLREMAWISPIESHEDGLDIYEKPQEGHTYLLSVDCAQGKELDYSTFSVIDVSEIPYRQVAKFRSNKISSIIFPYTIHKVATDYNKAYVLIELNEVGRQVADNLHWDTEYDNILHVKSQLRKGQQLGGGFDKNSQLGLVQNVGTRRLGCANLKTLIENDKLIIQDYDTIFELASFVLKTEKKYAADEGAHDDLVMSLVLFSWAVQQRYMKDLLEYGSPKRNLQKSLAENVESELVPFGVIDSGQPMDTEFKDKEGQIWRTEEAGIDPFGNPKPYDPSSEETWSQGGVLRHW